jgi:hypothetical protein
VPSSPLPEGIPLPLLPALRQVIELVIAWRIFRAFCLVVAIVMCATLPVWFLSDLLVGGFVLFLCMVPLLVIWAFATLIRGLRGGH